MKMVNIRPLCPNRAYMRIGRCIRKNDKMFWERLVYEMPHRRSDGMMRQQSEEDSDPGYSSASSLLMSSCNNNYGNLFE